MVEKASLTLTGGGLTRKGTCCDAPEEQRVGVWGPAFQSISVTLFPSVLVNHLTSQGWVLQPGQLRQLAGKQRVISQRLCTEQFYCRFGVGDQVNGCMPDETVGLCSGTIFITLLDPLMEELYTLMEGSQYEREL